MSHMSSVDFGAWKTIHHFHYIMEQRHMSTIYISRVIYTQFYYITKKGHMSTYICLPKSKEMYTPIPFYDTSLIEGAGNARRPRT